MSNVKQKEPQTWVVETEMDSIKGGVAFTSIIVNAVKLHTRKLNFWREMGLNPSRDSDLFDDKNMELFKNKDADSIASYENGVLHLGPSLRYKEMNNVLEYIALNKQDRIKQVIILGSGFDVRSVTYRACPFLYIEVDHPSVLSLKETILNKNKIDKNAVYICIDYIKEDLITNLVQNNVDLNKGTHFIWEGNSMYLPRTVVNELWNKIINNFKGPVSISMDYFTEDFINGKTEYEEHKKAIDTFKKLGAPFINGFNDINEFATMHNLKLIQSASFSDLVQNYGIHDNPIPELEHLYIAYMARESICD